METHPVPAFDIEVAFAFVLPLVGREREMERLRATSQGGLFFTGGVGAGKSRVLVEAARIGVEAGARVVASRGQDTGLRPMRVLHDMARKLLDLEPGAPQGVRAAAYAMLPDDPATAAYFAAVLDGRAPPDDGVPPAHHWFTLVRAVASHGPLVLLLDDLHFADVRARRVVYEVAERVRREGVAALLVASGQDLEVQEDDRCELRPLDGKHIGKLINAVFPGHRFAEDAPWLPGTIAAVTEGNPFHVAEILRVLRLGTSITLEDDEWKLADDFSADRLRELVPDALEAAVRARLAGLSQQARRVLQFAAVIGEEFDVALVKTALGDPGTVDRALEEMDAADLLRAVEGHADRLRFYSAIVAPVVRRSVRDPRLHLAVAGAMTRMYTGERRLRHALSIAKHLRAGHRGIESLLFTLDGCERLLSLQLPDRARRLLANAKRFAEDEAAPASQRARFHYVYGLACEATGVYDEGLDALTRFVEADSGGKPRSLARAYSRLARIHRARGEFDRSHECLVIACRLLEDAGDMRTAAFTVARLAELALDRGQLHEAEEQLARAKTLAEETGNEGAGITVAILAGRRALEFDRPTEARQAFHDAERRAAQLGDRVRRAAALKGLGLGAMADGYLVRAQERLTQAVDLYALMGDRPGLAAALVHLGAVHRASGRVDLALRSLRRAQRVFVDIGNPEGVAAARHQVGLLLRSRAKTTAAVRELAAAAEEYQRLRLPERHTVLRDLGVALADAGTPRASRLALARADRRTAPGPARRSHRVKSRTVRARLALQQGDLRRARVLADSALSHAARTTGHAARTAANLCSAEVALLEGDVIEARRAADTGLAFAREQGDQLAAAAAERVLLELAARAGRAAETHERAHRVARAYTGRADAGDGPARLLLALGRGLARTQPERAARFLRAAGSCQARMRAQGFVPAGVADTGHTR